MPNICFFTTFAKNSITFNKINFMKLKLQRVLVMIIACLGIFFSACEKEKIEKEKNQINSGKISYVTVDKVPFLIPTIEEFNSDYNYLSQSKINQKLNKSILDLNLDLNHIIEFEQSNGNKMYSIAVNENQLANQNFYIENLQILKIQDKLEPFIIRYNASNDSQKIDVNNFTGNLTIYDIDRFAIGNIDCQNGVPINYHWTVLSENAVNANFRHSWIWCFFYNLFHGGGHWNDLGFCDSPREKDTDDSGPNTLPIVVINIGGSTTAGSGQTSVPNSSGGASSVPLAPNQLWPADDGTLTVVMKSKRIKQRLLPNLSTSQLDWLTDCDYPTAVNSIYNYLYNHQNTQDDVFIKQVINKMIQNPGLYTNINPFLIQKNIDATALPPCAQNIVNNIKNLTQNDFAKIIALLGGANSPYTVNIVPVPTSFFGLNPPLANTTISQLPNSTLFDYTINIDSQYLTSGTQLSIATTILHELIHAYFFSLVANQYVNSNPALNAFPQLWDYYVTNSANMTPGGSPQHLVIAQSYRNILATAFQEFDTGVTLSNGQIPQQLYTDLAWGGLSGTPPYNSLSQSVKDRITAVNSAEETNTSQTENGVTHTPAGVPCN